MAWHRRPSRLTRAQKDRILREHGGVCHVCHHPGATQVDHVLNVAAWLRRRLPGDPDHPSNLAPIHGTPDGREGACLTCGEACHFVKTQREANAGRRRKAREPEAHPGSLV